MSQFDIRFPFRNIATTNSTSFEDQGLPGDISFRLSIKMPTGLGSMPIVQFPTVDTPSVNALNQNTQDAQQLEATLKERLQKQRNLQTSNLYQRPRCTEPSTLPTPPSTLHSERLTPIDGTEHPRTEGTGDAICDADNRQNNQRHARPAMPTASLKDPGTDAHMQANSPLYSGQPRQSRSPSEGRTPTPRLAMQRGREPRSHSPSPSPVGSARRSPSYSPTPCRGRSVDSIDNRGRMMDTKRLQRSPSRNTSSRGSSRSAQSRSRSRGGDSYIRTGARSTSIAPDCDQLRVKRVDSGGYPLSSPIACSQPRTPLTPRERPNWLTDESPRQGAPASLRSRISGESATSPVIPRHIRRRTCPFYHPTDRDRHPLDRPHPGYSTAEFEEAVDLYERGCILPFRLIKDGVTINPKNRQANPMRSPAKGKFSSGSQNHVGHSPQERGFNNHTGQAARSRSPCDSPTKRRKITGTSLYSPQSSFTTDMRGRNNYSPEPATTFRNATTMRRETGSYESKNPSDYYRGTRLGGKPPSIQHPRPGYGRQATASQTAMGHYRW